jgi:hypothetical protein
MLREACAQPAKHQGSPADRGFEDPHPTSRLARHDQGAGTPLLVETGVPAAVRERAAGGGRRVVVFPDLGAASAAGRDARGRLSAAGDPRKGGAAVVVP